MLRPLLALAIVALTALQQRPALAHGSTPAPTVAPTTSASSKRINTALGRKINLRPVSSNQRFPATGCQSRAATLPGSTGTLGPNGASGSQTVVDVPIGGGDSTASATQRAQYAEACGTCVTDREARLRDLDLRPVLRPAGVEIPEVIRPPI